MRGVGHDADPFHGCLGGPSLAKRAQADDLHLWALRHFANSVVFHATIRSCFFHDVLHSENRGPE
jgi:hypothetical protein